MTAGTSTWLSRLPPARVTCAPSPRPVSSCLLNTVSENDGLFKGGPDSAATHYLTHIDPQHYYMTSVESLDTTPIKRDSSTSSKKRRKRRNHSLSAHKQESPNNPLCETCNQVSTYTHNLAPVHPQQHQQFSPISINSGGAVSTHYGELKALHPIQEITRG